MKNRLIISLTLAAAVFFGCASRDPAVPDSNEFRQIVDIIIDENPDALILSIRGNEKLAHTEDRRADSKNIELIFLWRINYSMVPIENTLFDLN